MIKTPHDPRSHRRIITDTDRTRIHLELDRQTRNDAMAAARRMRDQYGADSVCTSAAVALARKANWQVVQRLRNLHRH